MTMLETRAQVKVFGGISGAFVVNNGLKQGDGLAPMLFDITLDWVIRQTDIDINNTLMYKSVQVVGYADDLDIMGRSKAKVEETLKDLEKATGKIGLNINNSKTKWMIQSRNTLISNQQIGSERFETMKDFKHLGSVITNDKKEWTDIQICITKGNQTYFALLDILKSRFVPSTSNYSQGEEQAAGLHPRTGRLESVMDKAVFWDVHGVLLVDFAKHGTTVNAAAYIQTLVNLRCALRDKHRKINADDIKLFHDNARPQVVASVREKINTFGWEVLQHPPYSPDLTPSDFHPMKKFLAGHRFATDAFCNIKMDLREVGYDDREWINLAQDRDQWRAYVRAAMNLWVP
ncbi:hypothetical protein ANN_04976 [Periplaneta americana]|uniref:Reverse transcriptase domain-containing protein n=1 Tax=Periplaneta americana TaxID=6978 RepID=A0ABQ8T9X2_PERAM|nr:hypothetical protein ANN_04976 [Periplaneta americana]